MELKSSQKGTIAEMAVAKRAIEKGWTVSLTLEGQRYDMVLDDGEHLYRAQVKWASNKGDHASVDFRASAGAGGKKVPGKTYSSEEIDVVLIFIEGTDTICWLGPDLFHEKGYIQIRLVESKNGQKRGIHFLEDLAW